MLPIYIGELRLQWERKEFLLVLYIFRQGQLLLRIMPEPLNLLNHLERLLTLLQVVNLEQACLLRLLDNLGLQLH